jgi:hypothetical protein
MSVHFAIITRLSLSISYNWELVQGDAFQPESVNVKYDCTLSPSLLHLSVECILLSWRRRRMCHRSLQSLAQIFFALLSYFFLSRNTNCRTKIHSRVTFLHFYFVSRAVSVKNRQCELVFALSRRSAN